MFCSVADTPSAFAKAAKLFLPMEAPFSNSPKIKQQTGNNCPDRRRNRSIASAACPTGCGSSWESPPLSRA